MGRRLAGAVIVTLMLAACGTSAGEVEGVPGTALMDGFVVAPGSRLVGPVFSFPEGGGGPRAAALMSIDDDPLAVYDEYADQARRLGVPISGSGTRMRSGLSRPYGTCGLRVGADTRPVGTVNPAKAHGVECYGAGVTRGGDASVTLETRWGGPSHHALLEVYPTSIMGDAHIDQGSTRASKLVPLPKVSDRSSVSEPGAPFGEEHNGFNADYRRFKLEAGSQVAADAELSGGNVVILRVDGDLEQVMRGYARQLGEGGATPPVRRARTPGGEVLMVVNSPSGGGAATLISDPTGRWILIRAQSD